MNIVIPIGGTGVRFSRSGYTTPKPLIKILGKPMIYHLLDSLDIKKEDKVYIVHRNDLNPYNFRDTTTNYFRDIDFAFIEIPSYTRGSAETLYLAVNQMDNSDPVVSLDCDTFYEDNILDTLRNWKYGNYIFYFHDQDTKPLYSYITMNEHGAVTGIAEKKRISENANTGAYVFESPEVYIRHYEKMESLDRMLFDNQEFYVSRVYQQMLTDDVSVFGIPVQDFHCTGTPFQLQTFARMSKIRKGSVRVCFDLDNTLVSYPKSEGLYETVKPIHRNISFLRFLKRLGCYIIIYSARRMKTHKGNVGKITADVGAVTIRTLNKFDIPYDELYFGKPYANIYIDDLAVNPMKSNLEKETGFYDSDVGCRHFNSITYRAKTVKKTAEDLSGEIYWYKHIPFGLEDLFPRMLSHKGKTEMVLEKIRGIPMSYLYSMGCLKLDHLERVMKALARIHTQPLPEDYNGLNIYANWGEKLAKRMEEFDFCYDEGEFYDIQYKLQDYDKKGLGIPSIIHGDPVFSNILLDGSDNLKFVDMRGELDGKLTTVGDKFYDYAKVYQSLVGYDYIIHDKEYAHDDIDLFVTMFENEIRDMYGQDRVDWLKVLTKGLLVSLLPLHRDNSDHCRRYRELIRRI